MPSFILSFLARSLVLFLKYALTLYSTLFYTVYNKSKGVVNMRTHKNCYFFKFGDNMLQIQTKRKEYNFNINELSITLKANKQIEKITHPNKKFYFYPSPDYPYIQN
jgi:hypothetical protein